MKTVEPEVYLVGAPLLEKDTQTYLEAVGGESWIENYDMDVNAGSHIPEFYGRLCYKSFAPGLNPNVTKIRQGNDAYLANILKIGHESILEHTMLNFVIHNVSRVVTHELVRHRVGTAISQESLRYVRLNEIGVWIPSAILNNKEGTELFLETIEHLEGVYSRLCTIYDIENVPDFHTKKQLTSAFRRIAPIGLSTTIGWSANLRTLRHVIQLRTAASAEEEIRLVFHLLAQKAMEYAPNVFQDFKAIDGPDNIPEYKVV